MKVLLEYLSERGSFPALVTVFSAFLASLAEGSLSSSELLCVVLIVSFQFYLQLHNKLYARLVPIEWLSARNRLRPVKYYRRVAWGLSLVPVFFAVSVYLPWVALVGILAVHTQEIFRLVKRFAFRNVTVVGELKRLQDLSPQVAVYVSGLADVAYQINQWLPVLEQLDERVVIIARQREIYEGIYSTELPVVHARNARHVEQVLESGVKVVLYPANPMQNLHALRHFKLQHYFINHGESDKAVNQNKLLLAYDKLLVGGPLAHRRLLGAGLQLRGSQVEYVGRPQAEMALNQIKKVAGPHELKTVLYAPTWEGFVEDVNYSSVNAFGLKAIESLVNAGFAVIFKPHPYTGSRSPVAAQYLEKILSFCSTHNVEVVDSLDSIHSCMNRSDALFTDISSVLNDYLVTRKPIVLCVTDRLFGVELSAEFPSSQAAYHLKTPERAGALLKTIAEQDRLRDQRESVRTDSLGEFPEGALKQFKAVITAGVNDAV